MKNDEQISRKHEETQYGGRVSRAINVTEERGMDLLSLHAISYNLCSTEDTMSGRVQRNNSYNKQQHIWQHRIRTEKFISKRPAVT